MNASSSEACCGVSSWSTMPCCGGDLADLLGRQPVHLERAALAAVDRDARSPSSVAQRCSSGGARGRPWPRPARTNSSTLVSAISRPRPITIRWSAVSAISLIRCDETKTVRPSAARPLEQVADPVDALGVEAVDRLVQDQRLRVAEQRRRDAEPLAHAERELARPLAGHLVQADEVDHLVDAALRDAVRLREGEQVVVGRAAGVDGPRLQQRADLVQRRGVVAVVLAVDGDAARGRRVQAEDHPHRGRLARAVRPEEAGHDARARR